MSRVAATRCTAWVVSVSGLLGLLLHPVGASEVVKGRPKYGRLGKANAVLLEVRAATPFAGKPIGDIPMRWLEVEVTVKASVPTPLRVKTFRVLVEQEVPEVIIVGQEVRELDVIPGRLGLQDWFPTKKGELLVVAFNGEAVRAAREMEPLSWGRSPEKVWHECEVFSRAVSREKKAVPAALAATIRKEKASLSSVFFGLVASTDRLLFDDKEVALAAAEYLREKKVPFWERAGVFDGLRAVVARDPVADRAIILAVIDLVFEAERNKSHPREIGNILMLLSECFFRDRPAACRPFINEETRKKLLRMVEDKKIVNDRRTEPLHEWLKVSTLVTLSGAAEGNSAASAPEQPPEEGPGSTRSRGANLWWVAALSGTALAVTGLVLGLYYGRRKAGLSAK